MVCINTAVAQNDDVASVSVFAVDGNKYIVQCILEGSVLVVKKRNNRSLESRKIKSLDFHHVCSSKNWIVDLKNSTVL